VDYVGLLDQVYEAGEVKGGCQWEEVIWAVAQHRVLWRKVRLAASSSVEAAKQPLAV